MNKLENIGLTSKQSSIYLALLELETASVNQIAKKAGINRSSSYVVLESLMKMGLVSISKDRTIRHYVASSPDRLVRIAEELAKKHTEILDRIRKILPELNARHKDTRHKPKVRVFEGIDSIKEAYYDIFNSGASELRAYANLTDILKIFPNFLEEQNARGRDISMKMFAINPAEEKNVGIWRKLPPDFPFDVALIPEDKFKFPCDMAIYGNTVAFVSPKEKFGIIIEHKEIAEMLRNSFNLSFEEAKRLDGILRKKKGKELKSRDLI